MRTFDQLRLLECISVSLYLIVAVTCNRLCSGDGPRTTCTLYSGNFSFRMRLLHFEKNFTTDRNKSKGCTAFVTASFDTEQGLVLTERYHKPLAELRENKQNNLLVWKQDKMFNYLVETTLSKPKVKSYLLFGTKCGFLKTSKRYLVKEMDLGSNTTIKVLSEDNAMAIVAVEITCQPGFQGYNCTTPCEKCNIERWPCADPKLSGPSCAYATLCANSACLNGGSCVLEREPSNFEALYQLREVDYSTKCFCKPDFAGRYCEIALSSRCTHDTCLGRGNCEEAYYGLEYGVVLLCHCNAGFTGKRCQISVDNSNSQFGDKPIREYALVIELLKFSENRSSRQLSTCILLETHKCILEVKACILADCQQLAIIRQNESLNLTPQSADELFFYLKTVQDLANWNSLLTVDFIVYENISTKVGPPKLIAKENVPIGSYSSLPFSKLVTHSSDNNFYLEALITLRCGPNKRGPNCDDSCDSPFTVYELQSAATDDCWPRQDFFCHYGIGNGNTLVGPSCLLRNWCKTSGCEGNNYYKCEMLQDRSDTTCIQL